MYKPINSTTGTLELNSFLHWQVHWDTYLPPKSQRGRRNESRSICSDTKSLPCSNKLVGHDATWSEHIQHSKNTSWMWPVYWQTLTLSGYFCRHKWQGKPLVRQKQEFWLAGLSNIWLYKELFVEVACGRKWGLLWVWQWKDKLAYWVTTMTKQCWQQLGCQCSIQLKEDSFSVSSKSPDEDSDKIWINWLVQTVLAYWNNADVQNASLLLISFHWFWLTI